MSYPARHMPLDYGATISVSVPIASVWLFLFAIFAWPIGWHSLWFPVVARMVFYWPIRHLFHRFPPWYSITTASTNRQD